MSTRFTSLDEAEIVPPSKKSMLEIERSLTNGDTDVLFTHIGRWLRKNRRRMNTDMLEAWSNEGLVDWNWMDIGRGHVPENIFYTIGTRDAARNAAFRYKRLVGSMETLALFREKPNVQVVLDRWKKVPPKKAYSFNNLNAMGRIEFLDHVEPLVILTEHYLALCAVIIPNGDKKEGRYHRLDREREFLNNARKTVVMEDYDNRGGFTGNAYG